MKKYFKILESYAKDIGSESTIPEEIPSSIVNLLNKVSGTDHIRPLLSKDSKLLVMVFRYILALSGYNQD